MSFNNGRGTGIAAVVPMPTLETRQEIMTKVGDTVNSAVKPQGYLASYLMQLQSNPLRTKMLTSGTLAGVQELLASFLAGDRNKHGSYYTPRVPKMAAYGALISAPLGHVLISILQRLFAGRISLSARLLQIVVSNLVVAPIQNTVYRATMAVIAGARSYKQVKATVQASFMPVMKITWVSSPIALAFAQQFLPQETWVPFFNFVAFVIGTYINAATKAKNLAAARKRADTDTDAAK